jgi:hypothetical protein
MLQLTGAKHHGLVSHERLRAADDGFKEPASDLCIQETDL